MILENFLVTAKLFVLGVLIATVIGVPIGLLMGGARWADAILSPYVWTIASLPRVALYPILVLFLGIGYEWSAP